MVKSDNIYRRLLNLFGENGEHWTRGMAVSHWARGMAVVSHTTDKPNYCLLGGLAELLCQDPDVMYRPRDPEVRVQDGLNPELSECEQEYWRTYDEMKSFLGFEGGWLAVWNDTSRFSEVRYMLTTLAERTENE